MPPFILQLPKELVAMITEQLCHRDLVRVSSTCKPCREHFVPLVFHTIRFGNDNKTADSAFMAAKKYKDHVRRLEFSYVAEPENVSDGEVLPPLESRALLRATRKLLKGRATSNADVVSFSLRIDSSREGRLNDSDDLSDLLHDTEHAIQTMYAEQSYRWRAVLNEAYRAIAKNLIVRKIELIAPWGYPLGGRKPDAIVFPLETGSLPLLQSLKLNHSFTCPELVRFIKARSATLSSLTLVDCVSDYKSAAERGYPKPSETWASFFSKITWLRPRALVNLSIEYEDDVITKFYNDNDFPDRERQRIERIEADKLERWLTKDPERKVFAYVGLDGHATMIVNAFVNRAQATKLDDYKGYQQLMRLVKENAQRIARKENQICAV
ncbi:hypothetical protein NHJ13734_000552 [Beauveria thailandica]